MEAHLQQSSGRGGGGKENNVIFFKPSNYKHLLLHLCFVDLSVRVGPVRRANPCGLART